jgi:hypothetical protein
MMVGGIVDINIHIDIIIFICIHNSIDLFKINYKYQF